MTTFNVVCRWGSLVIEIVMAFCSRNVEEVPCFSNTLEPDQFRVVLDNHNIGFLYSISNRQNIRKRRSILGLVQVGIDCCKLGKLHILRKIYIPEHAAEPAEKKTRNDHFVHFQFRCFYCRLLYFVLHRQAQSGKTAVVVLNILRVWLRFWIGSSSKIVV